MTHPRKRVMDAKVLGSIPLWWDGFAIRPGDEDGLQIRPTEPGSSAPTKQLQGGTHRTTQLARGCVQEQCRIGRSSPSKSYRPPQGRDRHPRVQNGCWNPNQNCQGVSAFTALAASKRMMVRSTKPSHARSTRR